MSLRSFARAHTSLLLTAAALTVASVPAAAQSPSAHEAQSRVTLRQLLDAVGARHPLVEAARARVRAAQGTRTTAGAFGNPVLTYQVENAPLPGRAAPPMDREAMTTAMLPLEPLYQRGPRVRRADAEVDAATAEAIAERRRVSLDAARAFYRTALAQVGHDAARDLATWLDSLVAYNRARVNEGAAAEADLIRSELERDRASADATMREADLARARATLVGFLTDDLVVPGLTVAIDSGALPFPADVSSDRSAPGHSFFTALADGSLASRPDVRAARQRLSAARAGVVGERSMFVRQLGAMLGTKQSAGSTSLIAGVSLPIPLFDQNRGEVRRAAAERDATAYEVAALERVARAEIVGAYEAARVLTDRATALAAGTAGYLTRADEARRIALGAYREGAVPLLQVLDAARAWGDARLAYYAILFAQHEAVLDLLVALGRDPSTPSAAGADDRSR